MAVMSIEEYSRLTDPVEATLDQADYQAAYTTERLAAEEVLSSARKVIHG